jgi:hypothetical protein
MQHAAYDQHMHALLQQVAQADAKMQHMHAANKECVAKSARSRAGAKAMQASWAAWRVCCWPSAQLVQQLKGMYNSHYVLLACVAFTASCGQTPGADQGQSRWPSAP